MKEILFKNWNGIRIIRLVLGIAIIIMAIQQQQILMAVAGAGFTLMALLNTGCAGSRCTYRPPKERIFLQSLNEKEVEKNKEG